MVAGQASRPQGPRFESRGRTVLEKEEGGRRGGEKRRTGLMQGVRVWKGKLEKERGPNRMLEVKLGKKKTNQS